MAYDHSTQATDTALPTAQLSRRGFVAAAGAAGAAASVLADRLPAQPMQPAATV